MVTLIKTAGQFVRRVIQFPRKTRQQRYESFIYRWKWWLGGIPFPKRLPIGVWWLMDFDFLGMALIEGGFENIEYDFAGEFVKPGMTVLDIGAHRGFYTLLFSKRVGPTGRVLSFEPSLRERKKLLRHVRINFRKNVGVKDCALGAADGAGELYVVSGIETGCNSLRPPDTRAPVSAVKVQVRKLDEVLSEEKIEKVDFIKLDVEGGELNVLKGAGKLLETEPRPVILCEVLDMRTKPWGYPARLIADYLEERNFVWFELGNDSRLTAIAPGKATFDGNYVAVPRESLASMAKFQTGG
jgi:FkbM family methyltransferase